MRARPAFLVLVMVGLGGCGQWEQQSVVPSPDGRLNAVLEYKGSAACCSDHSRLLLENAQSGSLTDPGIAVEATRASLKVHWLSNDLLLVEACDATNIRASSRMLREPVVKLDGSINALRVEVVTAPALFRDGFTFCAQSDAETSENG